MWIPAIGIKSIDTRIMNVSIPLNLGILSKSQLFVHEMYGTEPGKESFANNCLLARRLVERGVRFVQLYDSGWDHHNAVFKLLPKKCKLIPNLKICSVPKRSLNLPCSVYSTICPSAGATAYGEYWGKWVFGAAG